MAVKLPETTLEQIKEQLVITGELLDTAIVNENIKPENKEDQKKKIWEENIINKAKTNLSSDEKKRFIEISKLFVHEWIDQVKKFKQEQEKKNKLSGIISSVKKKVTAPFSLISDFLAKKKKKVEQPKEKKKMSWLTKLTLIIAGLGAAWFLFKNVISKIPDRVRDSLKNLGSSILEFAGDALYLAWDSIKTELAELWDWVKSVLPIEKIGTVISDTWNTLSGWFTTTWDKIMRAWNTVKEKITSLPGKIWDWICEAAKALFDPVINAITTAWNWLKEKVVAVWDWIKGELDKFWEGLKSTWESVVGFFKGIWDWVSETFSFEKIWTNIKKFVSWYIDDIKDSLTLLFTGHIKELAEKYVKRFISIFTTIIDKAKDILSYIPGVSFGDDDKKDEVKEQVKTKIKSDVSRVIEKQDELVLKDNILETVKDICDRINVFFSGNKNGFIDLSRRLIKQCTDGFKSFETQLGKAEFKNVYEIEQDVDFNDKYDQSDKSVKTINNDYSKNSNDDYSITYNTVDIPSLNNAVNTLQKQNEAEIKLLESQNDYLMKMINNIDGLGSKLNWLDPSKFKPQQNNTIIPIIAGSSRPGTRPYDTSDLKRAQLAYASAFNV